MFVGDVAPSSRRAFGQVIEWLVWCAVVGHSERTTHVFLPLDDRGVDGIVRRVDDEATCAVQVKGRSSLAYSEIRTVVRRTALDDPNVTFVVALLDPAAIALGETVYVMDADAVLRLGSASSGPNGAEVELRLPYPPRPESKWAPYACPLSDLVARLLPSAGAPSAPHKRHRGARHHSRSHSSPPHRASANRSAISLSSRSCACSASRPRSTLSSRSPTSKRRSTWCATGRAGTSAVSRSSV